MRDNSFWKKPRPGESKLRVTCKENKISSAGKVKSFMDNRYKSVAGETIYIFFTVRSNNADAMPI